MLHFFKKIGFVVQRLGDKWSYNTHWHDKMIGGLEAV